MLWDGYIVYTNYTCINDTVQAPHFTYTLDINIDTSEEGALGILGSKYLMSRVQHMAPHSTNKVPSLGLKISDTSLLSKWYELYPVSLKNQTIPGHTDTHRSASRIYVMK